MNKCRLLALAGLLVATSIFAPESFAQQAPDASELMVRSHQTTLIKGARLDHSFELRSASGAVRLRKVSSAIRTQAGTDESSRVARYEFPADAKGLATLLIEHRGRDDELWLYVPAIRKARHLVADNKRDSFMGTVLSQGDVLGYKPAEWRHELVGQEDFEGHPCWHVVSRPIDEAVRKTSGYEHRESWIDQRTLFTLRMDAWDEAGKPLKTILNRRVMPLAQQPGVFQAYDIEARDLQEGTVTKITVDHFQFEPNLPADEFTPAALEDES